MKPTVLFVCVHNAGRSQMAAALLERISEGSVDVASAGTAPGSAILPQVIEAVSELGIDLSDRSPQKLSNEAVASADVIVTMGCGDECPYYPGKRYEDWPVEDPSGKDLSAVREIRDQIEARVRALVTELVPHDPLPEALE